MLGQGWGKGSSEGDKGVSPFLQYGEADEEENEEEESFLLGVVAVPPAPKLDRKLLLLWVVDWVVDVVPEMEPRPP